MKIAVATDGEGGLDAVVATDFGRARTFTFVEVENGVVGTVVAMPNDLRLTAEGAGMAAAEEMTRKEVDVVIAGHVGPHGEEMLRQEGIGVLLIPKVTVRDAVERCLKGA